MKMMKLLVVLLTLLAAGAARAQWLNEQIALRPGWNAVWLEARPYPSLCEEQFAGLPVESVWQWNHSFRTTQFETDPSLPLPGDQRWLIWRPASHPQAFLNTLFAFKAGGAYLIRVASNAAPFVWNYVGKAQLPALEWFPYKLNFVGLPVHPGNPPVFSEFFRHTDEVDGLPGGSGKFYEIGASGAGVEIRQTSRMKIVPGKAYWILAGNPGTYAGPLEVVRGGSLDFGGSSVRQEMILRNVSPSNGLTITITPRSSVPAPAGQPEWAGDVPLSYDYAGAPAVEDGSLNALGGEGISRFVGPGESWVITWFVRRGDLAAFVPEGDEGAAYQSILEISDSAQQYRVRVPVLADNPALGVARRRASSAQNGLAADHPAQGLWMGDVALDQVSAPYFSGTNLYATPATFNLRVIVHVDGDGAAKLLQSVVMARAPVGVTTNFAYQLFTSADDVPGTATDVARLSSTAFPMMDPIPLGTVVTMQEGTFTGLVAVGCNDSRNPFLHRYHPKHDNKNGDWAAYTNAVETFDIARTVTIQLEPLASPSQRAIWGMDVAQGTYREVISGIHKTPLIVSGPLSLRRISLVKDLH